MLTQLGIMNHLIGSKKSLRLSGYDIRETVKIWERMKEFNKGKEPLIMSTLHQIRELNN